MYLKNEEGEMIDVSYMSDGWVVGDNETKQTMQKSNRETSDELGGVQVLLM